MNDFNFSQNFDINLYFYESNHVHNIIIPAIYDYILSLVIIDDQLVIILINNEFAAQFLY